MSNPEEQHQNAAAETLVNVLGRGARVLLLQSGLQPEFWGLAVLHICTVANMLQHSSLNGEILYFMETNHRPNVSWLLCFGCSAVVHSLSGKDLVEHGKLAPRGEH
eukprot:912026-Rhodomonas_salina.1